LFKEVLQFFEFEAGSPKLRMDSKAAKAIVTRLGVGLVRHLEVKILWIQSLTKQKRLQAWKVDGDKNIADLGTKVLAKDRFEMLLQMSNIRRMKDVEKIPETKCIGGVGLDAGCTAPEGSVTKAKFMLDALVALLQPRCSEALLRPPRSEVVAAAVPSQWHRGASWLEQDFRTRVAPHLSLQNSEEATAVVEGAEG